MNRRIRIPLLAGRIEDLIDLGIVFSVPASIPHRTRMEHSLRHFG